MSRPPAPSREPGQEPQQRAAAALVARLPGDLGHARIFFDPRLEAIELADQIARHLADRGSPWWCEGLGLAKAHGEFHQKLSENKVVGRQRDVEEQFFEFASTYFTDCREAQTP